MTVDPQPINPKVLVFLQNAWSSVEAHEYSPASWYSALRQCLTGKRLAYIFGDDVPWPDVRVENCSPRVGFGSESKFPAEPDHVRRVLQSYAQPETIVLGCGTEAAKVLPSLWAGPLILMPHPAWRFCSTGLLNGVKWHTEHRHANGYYLSRDKNYHVREKISLDKNGKTVVYSPIPS